MIKEPGMACGMPRLRHLANDYPVGWALDSGRIGFQKHRHRTRVQGPPP
ncbi:hypothetical protein [Enteractinococcus helveticum]|nr:hypothetical protein [Enteractinococcus helveticum]